jgi:hypothetical protein
VAGALGRIFGISSGKDGMPKCAQSQYSPLRHICNGVLLNHDPKSTWVFVMTGYSIYLDDAGHPADQPYLVVGGFIAREDRWIAFESAWKEILRIRQIDFPFHATDFFSKYKNDPKLAYIVADLVRVITNHVEASFSVALDIDCYKEFNRELRLEEVVGAPYALAMRGLRESVEEWQKIVGPRSPLLYFVESGTLHRGDMMDCLQDRDGVNPPIPVPKSHVACQAADLYAYSMFQTAIQGGVPVLSFKYFMEKLSFPKERRDAKIFRAELEAFLSGPNTKFLGIPDKVPIPHRSSTEGLKFTFEGNRKKVRRGTVGLPKKKDL